ncbi:MAG: hypothetical protein FJZ87_07295 [Chloroflexi bacterium]|nr:hypothetical protein [Chloroflexota bacterium]
MTFAALMIGIFLSVGSLGFGYFDAGSYGVSRWLFVLGLMWLVSQWRRWYWVSSAALFVIVFMAAFGLWLQMEASWMIAAAAFALFAWDMTEFRRRIRLLVLDDELRAMERRHIARVSLVILTGLLLVTLSLLLRLRITFEWGVFLVIVILLSLSQLLAWFRRQIE